MLIKKSGKFVLVLGISLLVPALAIGGVSVANAADQTTSGGSATLVLQPSSGSWASGNAGDPSPMVKLSAKVTCPSGSDFLTPFITEPGSELPAVTATSTVRSAYKISRPDSPVSLSGPVFESDLLDVSTFGSYATAQSASIPDVRAALEANHTYSFGLACSVYGSDMTFTLSDGKPIVVWTAFKTDAAKNWSVPAPKADTTVKLSGASAEPTSATLTAEVDSAAAGGTASDAKGSVEFFSGGKSVGTAAVSAGKASFKASGLTASTKYSYTAKYAPAADDEKYNASPMSDEVSVTTAKEGSSTANGSDAGSTTNGSANASGANGSATSSGANAGATANGSTAASGSNAGAAAGGDTAAANSNASSAANGTPATLSDGGSIEAGKSYTVAAPAGTFTAGDSIAGELHSDPIALTETASAAADGSASYTFTVPASLPAGAHQLILTGTPSGAKYTLNLTASGAGNSPFAPLTNWISSSAATPAGITMIFGLLLLLVAATAVGWHFLIKRRAPREN
ncbi:MAG: hypothetical protein IIZ13_16135 [Renibacterium sp.]|nr:hypothetical protein [Renibacterium sp.]